MQKNPFSLLDFLGYVFPGAFGILVIYFIYSNPELRGLDEFIYACQNVYNDVKVESSIESTLFFMLLSYVIGHFIAYLSSITVENFAVWLYGYPSDFLLGQEDDSKSTRTCRVFTTYKTRYFLRFNRDDIINVIYANIWRSLVGFFLMPILLCSIFIGKILAVERIYIKKLDDDLISSIYAHSFVLSNFLGYYSGDRETDFHRVIHHYEYEQQPNHARTMDNYVALYDFLRSICLIFNCLFLYLFFVVALPSIDFSMKFDSGLILMLCSVMLITYIFFMSFMKFYRRYTLENFMCLLIDQSYR